MAEGITPKDAAGGGAEPARADGVAGRRWEWWSTHESVAAEVPSVWAIVESVLAVAAYWCAAIWLETYAFLLAGVAIAPMVLLRSDASVADGLRWFQDFEARNFRFPPWREMSAGRRALVLALVSMAVVVGLALCWWQSSRHLVGLEAWHAFLGGAAIGLLASVIAIATGIVVAGRAGPRALLTAGSVAAAAGAGGAIAIAGAASAAAGAAAVGGVIAIAIVVGNEPLRDIVATNVVVLVIFGVSFALAIAAVLFVASVATRTFATLRHLPAGVLAMPRNFRRLIVSTSPMQTPELVPGLATTNSSFRLDEWIETEIRGGDSLDRLVGNIVLLAYIPAWAYRVSIKSTAWFWWPLAYIGREPHEARDPEHMRKLVQGSPFRRLGRWIAIGSLFAFLAVSVWDYLRTKGLDLPALPTQTLVIGFVLTRLADVPWQLAGLLSAAMALLAGMLTSHAAISLDHAKKETDVALLAATSAKFVKIERIARFGFVCTVAYWLALAGHLGLYVNNQRCWFEPPPGVTAWAKRLYGELAPPPPRCSA
jgi:hypothetical protein